ncbi:MAG: hypothetical protein WBD07_07905 [Vicinamibacterales bacterium]
MRSPTARLAAAAAAGIAFAAGAFFTISSERQIAAHRAAVRTFDLHAREASDELSDLRGAEQAYVAVGQGVGAWMPKVAQSLDAAARTIASLRQSATSVGGRSALDDAATALSAFSAIDKRAREFLASDQPFMAGDVIFAEGQRTVATASQQVEAARVAEFQAFDATYMTLRGRQALALAACGVVAALVILLLGLTGATGSKRDAEPALLPDVRTRESELTPGISALTRGTRAPTVHAASPVLSAAVRLCTDFGRVRDLDDVSRLLVRGADAMDATGLVVWLGSAAGADLQPVLAHGYSQQGLARMPPVARSSDNAAAAAYRTGELQIVRSRANSIAGAIVAPILSADGCIGAFSAEIRSGGEGSESVQAFAAILAAQLAGILTASPPEAVARDKTA